MSHHHYTLTEEQRLLVLDSIRAYYLVGCREDLTALIELFKPQELTEPMWRREPFTDEDRKNMLDMREEEVRGSVTEIAKADLDNVDDMVELVSYADEDPQVTADLLNRIRDEDCCIEDYETSDYWNHVHAAAFMRRMGLVKEDGKLSDLGIKYLEEYK